MKIIEALKKTKDLERKADDLISKIEKHSAITNLETPVYTNQKKQIAEWLQSHNDVLKEILKLRIAIQKTNLETEVTIEIGNKQVTKTIAEWIHRRRDLAEKNKRAWLSLTDRNIQEGIVKSPSGDPIEIKITRYYDPVEKDNKIEEYASEPNIIDSKLEIVNAITDLIE